MRNNEAKYLNKQFTREDIQMVNKDMKNAQHHFPLEKCKLNTIRQSGIATCVLNRQKLKYLQYMCWWGCEATETLLLLMENVKWYNPLESSLPVFYIIKCILIIGSVNSNLSYIIKIKMCPYKNMYMNIHNNFIFSSQKLKTIQISINCWMDKHICCISSQWNTSQQPKEMNYWYM